MLIIKLRIQEEASMEKQSMSEIIKQTLKQVNDIADTKTVIGDPITLIDGVTIIPVSRISVGTALGGGEYGNKKQNKKENEEKVISDNFTGGGGTGISIIPVAFLIITADGEAKLLNVGENTGYLSSAIVGAANGIDTALDKAPDIIEKVKELFKGKKKGKKTDDEDEDEDEDDKEDQEED